MQRDVVFGDPGTEWVQLGALQAQMTLDELTVPFSDGVQESLLSEWRWLVGDKLPLLVTASGNAFVFSVSNGSVHELDTAAGTLTPVARSVFEFRERLVDLDFIANRFHVARIRAMAEAGCPLATDQVYGFKHPPLLGGDVDLGNVEPIDLELHFFLTGQMVRKFFEQAKSGATSPLPASCRTA
jgi:hypothetical protein